MTPSCSNGGPACSILLGVTLAVTTAAGPVWAEPPSPSSAQGAPAPETRPEGTAPFPKGHRLDDYANALRKARAWVDALVVDPVDLMERTFQSGNREYHIKGIKKLTEILWFYVNCDRRAKTDAEHRRIRERVEGLARATERPEYCQLLIANDTTLVENATSYLRALVLLDDLGIDTTHYRESLAVVKPHLDRQMSKRGPSPRAMFAKYYDRYGLEKPPELFGNPLEDGLIERRHPIERYDTRTGYLFTHEILAAYDYGVQREQDVYDADDLAYVRKVLPYMAGELMKRRDVDLLAEFVNCYHYVGAQDAPEYRQAIDYLLDHQNQVGTWGNYERFRGIYGDYVDQLVYLHTTAVVAIALMEAYEDDWPIRTVAPQDSGAADRAALFREAWELQSAGRWAEAETQYRRLLERYPDHVQARFNLAYGLMEAGRHADAVAQFVDVLKRDPDRIAAHHWIAQCSLALGDAAAASRHTRAYLFGTAWASHQAGRWLEAEAAYRKLLEQYPDHVQGRFNLAHGQMAAGNFAEAIGQFKGVLRRNPSYNETHHWLSKCYKAIGDETAAERHAALYAAGG